MLHAALIVIEYNNKIEYTKTKFASNHLDRRKLIEDRKLYINAT